jgi:membrane associated rhomboid family serine protease
MLGLYFFGKPLEERYGSREFLRFYLIALLTGTILWGTRAYLLSNRTAPPAGNWMEVGSMAYGASGAVTACIILFCLLYPRATVLHNFLFPIPAWIAGLLIVVNNLFGVELINSTRMHGIAYDVHLFGAVFALGYWYFGWNFGSRGPTSRSTTPSNTTRTSTPKPTAFSTSCTTKAKPASRRKRSGSSKTTAAACARSCAKHQPAASARE